MGEESGESSHSAYKTVSRKPRRLDQTNAGMPNGSEFRMILSRDIA